MLWPLFKTNLEPELCLQTNLDSVLVSLAQLVGTCIIYARSGVQTPAITKKTNPDIVEEGKETVFLWRVKTQFGSSQLSCSLI